MSTAEAPLELVVIAENAGVEIGWLARGDGPMTGGDLSDIPGISTIGSEWNDFAMAPRLEVKASAGHDSLVEHEDAVDMIAFHEATNFRIAGRVMWFVRST